MSSYFYFNGEQKASNADLITLIQEYSEAQQTLVYLIDRPLTDQKYSYTYKDALILLSPKNKIAIIDYGNKPDEFSDYIEDLIEDLGAISDKYQYKGIIGRTRKWRDSLVVECPEEPNAESINDFMKELELESDNDKKKIDLLISLFIGSINDINRVKEEVPVTTLDKVKQKIQLFDADQTSFIYQTPNKKRINIQGLSGTGKTELLLHKLKDIYINEEMSRIFFTCHNKVLANSLKNRIPDFFNFMKVEQQIEWDKRLWCSNSWGKISLPNSGAYRYICAFYNIPFYGWSYHMPFSRACKLAIDDITLKKESVDLDFAFDYMFIDESQDFDEVFFALCEIVTKNNIFVAGDIFQSIFDENIALTIEPDFLLGKCYRTDPKTLMFAHGLGMGLFEKTKLRWLEEKEWKDCGYNVAVNASKYHLSREPLRRFEDMAVDFESIRIVEIENSFSDTILEILNEIIDQNETVTPEDIGIILLDKNQNTYILADILEERIQNEIGWKVNKTYESKSKMPDSVLISNRNNVKGLEFPFVICVTERILKSPSYRNALYTMLTRSFIKSYFLTQPSNKSGLEPTMKDALKYIVENQEMVIDEPSEAEKKEIQTRFEYSLKNHSFFDLMISVCNELGVEKKYQDTLLQAAKKMDMLESNRTTLKEFVSDNMKYLPGKII